MYKVLNIHGLQSNQSLHSLLLVETEQLKRPAAAKTIHRSQGDTEKKIVVNYNTKRAIPHIYYVDLSRLPTTEGMYITDL